MKAPSTVRLARHHRKAIYVATVGSRGFNDWLVFGFLIVLLMLPVVFMGPSFLLLFPFSIPVTALSLWYGYCIVVNRQWSLSVSRKYLSWDRLVRRAPQVVPVSLITKATLVHDPESPPTLYLELKGGTDLSASPPALVGLDVDAFIAALRQVAPQAKIEPIVRGT